MVLSFLGRAFVSGGNCLTSGDIVHDLCGATHLRISLILCDHFLLPLPFCMVVMFSPTFHNFILIAAALKFIFPFGSQIWRFLFVFFLIN